MVDIRTVGVIGAGQMGSGIAHVCALGGYDVLLHDVSPDRIDQGIAQIEKNMVRQVSRGVIAQDAMEAAVKRIKAAPELQSIGGTDLAIEAATENEETKKTIFGAGAAPEARDAAGVEHVVDLDHPAGLVDRPARQVHRPALREPGAGHEAGRDHPRIATDADTYDLRSPSPSRWQDHPNAEDFPAFIVNRVLVPMINEAIYTLYEGVGTVDAIDTALRLGANHPMGPLELGDFIGLDTVLSIMNVLYDGLADSKYRPCPLLVKYVEAGWLGRKSGRGFYDYRGEKPVPTR